MNWLAERYVITAADAAAAWTGRAWNASTRKWEDVSGTDPTRSLMTRYRLKSMHVYIYNTSSLLRSGVWCSLLTYGDPYSPNASVRLPGCELQGAGSTIHWSGDTPMMAGVFWRVRGVATLKENEIVDCVVGYE